LFPFFVGGIFASSFSPSLSSCLPSGHTIFWPTPSTLASPSSIHGAGARSSLLNWC
ncbi:hypothetical protein L211DRAFT_843331, partial [Terfezia boudieri ATCC MYA-4762]